MLNAKINVNGIEWNLTGDKEDIVYALRNATSSSIPTVNDNEIIQRIPNTIPLPTVEKKAKYTKNEIINMYEYLETQGDFRIQQFEITRGGKANPTQYTVCLVFDQTKQRYWFYNPKTEDRFIQTFTINDVITRINASESGFSLLHTVANKIWEKMEIVNNLTKISNNKTNPFPILNPTVSTANTVSTVAFKNYETTPSFMTGIKQVMKKNEWTTATHIWNRMAKAGFTSKGKTPENTVASLIYMDIKNNGTNSVFERESGKQAFRLKS